MLQQTSIPHIFFISSYAAQTNIKDLQALTLVGPTRENLVLDPLAIQHLDNQLFRIKNKILVSDNICSKALDYFLDLSNYLNYIQTLKFSKMDYRGQKITLLSWRH